MKHNTLIERASVESVHVVSFFIFFFFFIFISVFFSVFIYFLLSFIFWGLLVPRPLSPWACACVRVTSSSQHSTVISTVTLRQIPDGPSFWFVFFDFLFFRCVSLFLALFFLLKTFFWFFFVNASCCVFLYARDQGGGWVMVLVALETASSAVFVLCSCWVCSFLHRRQQTPLCETGIAEPWRGPV